MQIADRIYIPCLHMQLQITLLIVSLVSLQCDCIWNSTDILKVFSSTIETIVFHTMKWMLGGSWSESDISAEEYEKDE